MEKKRDLMFAGMERSGTSIIKHWLTQEGFNVQVGGIDGAATPMHDVVVVRSLLNWWASRSRWDYRAPNSDVQWPSWEQHAKFALEFPHKAILYDKWIKSKKYRESIISRYGKKLRIDHVTYHPQEGSTFNDMPTGPEDYIKMVSRYKVLSQEERDAIPERLLAIDRRLFGDCYES